MVVIEGCAFFQAQIVAIPVVAIVLEHDDLVGAKAVDDAADHGGLAGAGAAGDADHGWRSMTGGRWKRHRLILCALRTNHQLLTPAVVTAARRLRAAWSP